MRRFLIPAALLAGAVAVLLVRRDLNEPHLRLFSDMVNSPAYHSQQPNPVFRDGRTLQRPVPGTIARDWHPLHYGVEAAERERAGAELKNPFLPGFEVTARGKQVFENYCSHCHGLAGLGDGEVAKAFPQFSFPLASKSTFDLPDGTLFHIITYGRNLMPSHASQLDPPDRWKAVCYLRDLQREEIARLGPAAVIPEDPRRRSLVSEPYGKELFAMNCASCHGEEGRRPNPGIPTLNSPAVLAIADDAYYWDIINHGRPGTQMPAWKNVLTGTQMRSIVMHIRSWAGRVPETARITSAETAVERGRAIFASHCIGCHGPAGRGGIGNSLNAPSFLALASDLFLRQTISLGRRHTAMPASFDLKGDDISDLISLIRSWAAPAPPYAEVAALLPGASPQAGKTLFEKKCAGCHGANGEGAIGSRLNSESFLAMAGDELLYRAIVEGRPTEMPAWRSLGAREVADVISRIRSWQKGPSVALSTQTHQGRPEFGEVLYKQECVKCHGLQGEGDLGTQIGNPVLLGQLSDDFLWRTVAYGKGDTEMKGFLKRARNPLSGDDIDHIIAFVRRLERTPPAEPLRRHYSWASAKDGRKVYEQKGGCMKCHGAQGEGGSGPSLGNPAFLKTVSDGFLAGTVILGREVTPMKSYYSGETRLAGEDIENVIGYIRTFENAAAPAVRRVESTPELVAAGRVLYRETCAKCHGLEGKGKHENKPEGFAPSLNNEQFLKAADDNFLLATIALGRPGTPMRAFGDGMGGRPGLSAEQIRRIVAFLRSWEWGTKR
ncbi:MAG: c-type cytochrome [Elusimicrobia bacterium]|nr:c-type cytochrome [Elusimicrobiota bacterium]